MVYLKTKISSLKIIKETGDYTLTIFNEFPRTWQKCFPVSKVSNSFILASSYACLGLGSHTQWAYSSLRLKEYLSPLKSSCFATPYFLPPKLNMCSQVFPIFKMRPLNLRTSISGNPLPSPHCSLHGLQEILKQQMGIISTSSDKQHFFPAYRKNSCHPRDCLLLEMQAG